MSSAIVSLSGGQDSATCLAWAKENFFEVYTISFYYGQKHRIELEASKELSKKAEAVDHYELDISHLFSQIITSSALLQNNKQNVNDSFELNQNLPASFVPFRNLFLLSTAAAKAYHLGVKDIVTGICETDYCIPEDEFVTTDFGKVPIRSINPGNKILSSDPKTGKLSFKEVINKFENGYRNDIVEITTEAGRKIKTTLNHKIYKVNRSNYSEKGWEKTIVLDEAKNLKEGDFLLNPSPQYNLINDCYLREKTSVKTDDDLVDLLKFCQNPKLKFDENFLWFRKDNKVNRYVHKDNLVELLGWFIAEGNRGSGNRSNSNSYRIGISQSQSYSSKSYERITQLAKNFGFNVTCEKDMIYFSGPSTEIFELCGSKSTERKIPLKFMFLNMPLLFNTLIEADGSITQTNSNYNYTYTTKSELLKEQICWMGTLLGFSTGVHYHKEREIYNISMVKNHKKKMNRIGELKMCKIKKIKKINTETLVYDITVEDNHNFIAGKGSGLLVSNSGYPDCRDSFRGSLEETLSYAVDEKIRVHAPLMCLNKAQTVQMMLEFGKLNWYALTHTCYNGQYPPCRECNACILREKGFEEAGITDPLLK